MSELDRAALLQRELFLSVLTPTRPTGSMARRVAQSMREMRFARGEVIFAKGERADSSYFVSEGIVRFDDDDADPLPFGVGDVVGIVDLNLDRPRAHTARAHTDVVLLQMNAEDWLDVQEENVEWVIETRRFVSDLVHRLMLECADSPAHRPGIESTTESPARPYEGTLLETLVLLSKMIYFERASVQSVAELARRAGRVQVQRGAQITTEAPERTMLVVAEGLVEAERRGEPNLRAWYPSGTLVLGGAGLCGVLGEYDLVALADTQLLVLRFGEIDEVVEDHTDLSRSLMRGIAFDREHWLAVRRSRNGAARQPT